jgi:hypothetical protein
MKEHRSEAKSNLTCSLGKHLRSTGHHDNFDEMKVTIIENDPIWSDKERRKRESFWIRKLKTLSPNGINVYG